MYIDLKLQLQSALQKSYYQHYFICKVTIIYHKTSLKRTWTNGIKTVISSNMTSRNSISNQKIRLFAHAIIWWYTDISQRKLLDAFYCATRWSIIIVWRWENAKVNVCFAVVLLHHTTTTQNRKIKDGFHARDNNWNS